MANENVEETHLTQLEELFMETLVARLRLGENLWTFGSRMTKVAKSLELKGLINWKSGIVEKTIMVWPTEKGRKEWMAFDYNPPILKDYVEADKFYEVKLENYSLTTQLRIALKESESKE